MKILSQAAIQQPGFSGAAQFALLFGAQQQIGSPEIYLRAESGGRNFRIDAKPPPPLV